MKEIANHVKPERNRLGNGVPATVDLAIFGWA